MLKEDNYIRTNLLSIDAWRDEYNWTWNQWYNLENDIYWLESELTTRRILKALRKWNYLTNASKGKLTVDDDGYNLVIINKDTYEPILALCYGEFE